MEVFSKRLQKHLKAQRMIFRDEKAKVSSRQAFKQRKESILTTYLAQMVAIVSPERPIYLHV